MEENRQDGTMERRGLLKRAGVVIAGAVGTGLVVNAAPAAAAPGNPALLGVANDAGTAETRIANNSSANATLELRNAATSVDGTYVTGHPTLRLEPNGDALADSEPGSMGMSESGYLWYVPYENAGSTVGSPAFVYSNANASMTVAFNPSRVLDTRTAAGRRFLLNAGDVVNGAGQLIGGRWAQLSLAELVTFGEVAFGNVIAVEPAADGWLAIAPWYPETTATPSTSNVNYVAGQVLANAFVTAIGYDPSAAISTPGTDIIGVYTEQTSHVVVDLMAFTVGTPEQINPGLFETAATATARSTTRKRRTTDKFAGTKN